MNILFTFVTSRYLEPNSEGGVRELKRVLSEYGVANIEMTAVEHRRKQHARRVSAFQMSREMLNSTQRKELDTTPTANGERTMIGFGMAAAMAAVTAAATAAGVAAGVVVGGVESDSSEEATTEKKIKTQTPPTGPVTGEQVDEHLEVDLGGGGDEEDSWEVPPPLPPAAPVITSTPPLPPTAVF
tara:strand:- start:644 stop:1198 length:555 start_codon:yes stop_codon:yes gene_type:complete